MDSLKPTSKEASPEKAKPFRLGNSPSNDVCWRRKELVLEIERKFLIFKPVEEELEKYSNDCSQIIQTYLEDDGSGCERRIRQRGHEGNWRLFVTEKFATASARARDEREHELSVEEYLDLMAHVDTEIPQISKQRWLVEWVEHVFEIDVYPFSNEYALMEVELDYIEEEFEIPEFVHVVREVTEDPAYRNSTLALTHCL